MEFPEPAVEPQPKPEMPTIMGGMSMKSLMFQLRQAKENSENNTEDTKAENKEASAENTTPKSPGEDKNKPSWVGKKNNAFRKAISLNSFKTTSVELKSAQKSAQNPSFMETKRSLRRVSIEHICYHLFTVKVGYSHF